jgi:DNA-binding CsgD family transcriptional regulator
VYQTKITGIDKDWSAPSASRNLSVLEFSQGNYVLEVRAREDGKLWSKPLAFHFEIGKPWYSTWWAILIFIACGVVVVMVATSIHNTNLIRQKRNLQRTVEERTNELNRQKNEMIEQQTKIIQQKEEIISKNEAVYKSQQALNEADMNYLHLKEKQLQDQIDYKNKQITTHTLNILQKNESLNALKKQLEDMVKNAGKIPVTEIKKTLKTIDESFKLDKDWDDFKLYFEQIHTGFYAKLKISYPELTPLELRHCALIRLNLTLAECASILGISNDSLKVSRTRLRKKLNLSPNQSLTDFIIEI